MYRMLTFVWALGVVLFASQAQAVAPIGETAGSVRTEIGSEFQSNKKAYPAKRRAKSVNKRRRAKVAAHSRRTAQKSRRSKVYAYRSRRFTSVAQADVSQKAKRTRRAAVRKGRRTAKSVPVGTTMTGLASYYWQPQRVASGGWFNPKAMTAAHKTLPFGTRVRVTNKRNGRSVEVTINDRGPYIPGRIIDLSDAAAGKIGMKKAGVVPVHVEVVGR
jgi:rare lipoprotein A